MNIFASSAGRLLTHCRIRIILNTGETPSGGFVCLGLSDFDLASAARALEFSVPRLDLNSPIMPRNQCERTLEIFESRIDEPLDA